MNIGFNWVLIFLNLLIDCQDVENELNIGPCLSDESPEGAEEAKWVIDLENVGIENNKVTNKQSSRKHALICSQQRGSQTSSNANGLRHIQTHQSSGNFDICFLVVFEGN